MSDNSNRMGSKTATLTQSGIGTIGFSGSFTVLVTNAAGAKTLSSSANVVVNKAPQTINFPPIADQLATAGPFSISATASSEFLVDLSVISGPATLNEGIVTLTGAGVVRIRASQAGDLNYESATADQTFNVTKAPSTVTIGDLIQTYDGETKVATITTNPAGLSVNLTYDNDSTLPKNAGTYSLKATVSDAFYSGNASGTLVVSKAPLTVKAEDESRYFGVENPTLSITYSGFVNGETKAVLKCEPTAHTIASSTSPVGTYPITLSDGRAANYELTLQNGTLVVNKASQTIDFPSIPDQLATAGPISISATANSGLAVALSIISGPATLNEGIVTLTGAGVVRIRASQAGDLNYESATADQTFNVTKAPSTVTIGDLIQTYDGETKVATITTNPAGLSVNLTYDNDSTLPKNAGTYSLKATVSDAFYSGNASGTLVVSKAPLTVKAEDESRYFGVENPTLSITYSGFVNGETKAVLKCEPTAHTIASITSPVGSYPITLSNGSADNYVLTMKNGTLTVAPIIGAGCYFGKIGTDGGSWALYVHADNTGTFIAYLSGNKSALVVRLAIDSAGSFIVSNTGAAQQHVGGGAPFALASIGGKKSHALASDPVLTGRISADGTVSGALAEAGFTFEGSVEIATGPRSPFEGYYTATVLGINSGSTFAIIAESGKAMIVTTDTDGVEAAIDVVDASGHLASTTTSGGHLALTLDASNKSLTASLTPVDSSTTVRFSGISGTIQATKQLVNISCRSYGGAGDRVTIGGFVIAGTAPKQLLIRAVGPTLSDFGLDSLEVLQDPVITVHDASHGNSIIATNDNWGDNSNSADLAVVGSQLGAFSLTSGDTCSAALLTSLQPGVYTIVASGKDATSGIALVEIYDADPSGVGSTFVNVSTRAYCATNNGVSIGGFATSGNAPKRVLLRAVGPTLTSFGINTTEVLSDPIIEVHDASLGNSIIASNDNWEDHNNSADVVATGARVGAIPFGSADTTSSALLITLQPGVYSFVASGKTGTSGIVLVEVYDAD